MNCRSFPEIATSIARGELIDAAILEDAQAHAAICAACGSHLADETRLNEGLKLLARADDSRGLAGFDETRLRDAFRAHATNAPTVSRQGFSYVRFAAAIAAAAVVFFGASMIWRRAQVGPTGSGEAVARVTPTVEAQTTSTTQHPGSVRSETPEASIVASRRSSRVRPSARVDGSYVDARLGEFRPANYEPEETTEFIPTIQGSDSAPLSSGQVVRVMVPKSAMSYFGLPVNVDRANERVAADVLLGEDGLARAIRFVR
jgi:hypothetical protein